MQLLLIIDDVHVTTNVTAIRNVCNATLSLLFTTSLFIWGLLVNRKQAWRTDGGTAIFGCAALSLALVGTSLNFLYVHKEVEFVWLPGLMWAVVLWQSFVGWWWWVGAGSGSGFATEDENRAEKLRREAKKASRKREAREKKKGQKIKAQQVWEGVTAVFAPTQSIDPSLSQLRSRTPFGAPHIQASSVSPEPHSTSCESLKSPLSDCRSDTLVASDPNSALSISASESVESQSNTITTAALSLPRALTRVFYTWYLSLRHAHVTAARQQTAERVQWIERLDNDIDRQNPWGWGWGGFGWRSKVRRTSSVDVNESIDTLRKSEDEYPQTVSDWRTGSFEGSEKQCDRTRNHEKSRTDHDCQDTSPNHDIQLNAPLPPPVAALRPSSMWWWGPLRRWRLQDSTVY
jgi:hypothetical protein